MDAATLSSTFQSHLNDNLTVPVQTTGAEESRPVPGVLLENLDLQDITYHNTPLWHVVEHDLAGTSDERWFRFHYRVRLEYAIRHKSDISALRLFDNVRSVLEDIAIDPRGLHSDLRDVSLRGGGEMQHSFVENTESELNQSVVVESFDQRLRDNYDSIDQITKTFTIN